MNNFYRSNSLTLNSNTGNLNNGIIVNNNDLPSLKKRRKSVSFSEVNVVNVENWKSFNSDMSKENEYMKLRQEVLEFKKRQKEIEDRKVCGCNCNVF